METTRIQKYYSHVIVEDLILILNCKSIMELPAMKRIILSTSSQSFGVEKQEIINAFAIYLLLSGQKGVSTRARNSIAAFGVRKDSIIGCSVTLRKERLYAFFDKLITFVFPRERLQPNVNRLSKIKFCDSKKSNQSLSRTQGDLYKHRSRQALAKVLPHTFASTNSEPLPTKPLDSLHEENLCKVEKKNHPMHQENVTRFSTGDQIDWTEKTTREFHLGVSESRNFPEIENMFEKLGSLLGLNISFSINTSKRRNSKICTAFACKYTANIPEAFANTAHTPILAKQIDVPCISRAANAQPKTEAHTKISRYRVREAPLALRKADLSQTYQSYYSGCSKNPFREEVSKTYDKDLLFLSAFQFPCT